MKNKKNGNQRAGGHQAFHNVQLQYLNRPCLPLHQLRKQYLRLLAQVSLKMYKLHTCKNSDNTPHKALTATDANSQLIAF